MANRDLIVHTHPRSSIAECCRTIRTNLTFMSSERPFRTLLVTSPGAQEGKTTTATSLAIVLAQMGHKVLLVDTDLRRPRLHKVFFGVPPDVGMTTLLLGETALDDVVRATEVPGLSVLPCGPIPPNPAELLQTTTFTALLHTISEKYDRVIFDSPPVGAVTDAVVLGAQTDGVLLVLRAEKTTRDAALFARRQLLGVGARLFGATFNFVDLSTRREHYYYYYRSGYGYHAPEAGLERAG